MAGRHPLEPRHSVVVVLGALLVASILVLARAPVELLTVGSATAVTSYTASLGAHGGARWTVGASVYVNLKAMRPGTWKEELWSGTCATPGERMVVLPGLLVTSTRSLARTTKFANDLPRGDGVVSGAASAPGRLTRRRARPGGSRGDGR